VERRDIDIIIRGPINWAMYRDKTVLVTGATGRIGRYIVEALLEADIRYNYNMRIIAAVRDEEKAKEVLGSIIPFPNALLLVQDINTPIAYDGKVDYIFHTAGPAAPINFKETAVETLWAHTNGTHNILEFARTHNTRKVFYVSTVEVYGEWKVEKLISESDMGPLYNLRYRSCYPEAKRLCETMLACYKEEYGIDYCGVRLCHTLGPGIALHDGRAFAEFINCALNGHNIVLHSDGSAMRTYTYIADAINAMFIVMDKGESGVLYNVASNENTISIKDLAELIASLSPSRKTNVVFGSDGTQLPYLPFKLAIMDTTKIRQLGWEPIVRIEDTFKWTMESFA